MNDDLTNKRIQQLVMITSNEIEPRVVGVHAQSRELDRAGLFHGAATKLGYLPIVRQRGTCVRYLHRRAVVAQPRPEDT
jgi:hypothetical protein